MRHGAWVGAIFLAFAILPTFAGCSQSDPDPTSPASATEPIDSEVTTPDSSTMANWITTNAQLIDPINRITVTDDGVVWAATTGFGLMRIRPNGVGWERLELETDEFTRTRTVIAIPDSANPSGTIILFAVDGIGLYSLQLATDTLRLVYESDPSNELTWILDVSHDVESGEIIAVGGGVTVRISSDSTVGSVESVGYTDVLHIAASDRVLGIVRGKIPSIETPENIGRLVEGSDREPSSNGFSGTANELAQDPFDVNTVYLTSNDGVWISRDAGESWSRRGLEGVHTWAISVSGSEPGLIAVSTRGPGVYVSQDSGASWVDLGLNPLRTYGWATTLDFGESYEGFIFVGTREGSVFKQHLTEDRFALVSGAFPEDSPRTVRETNLRYPIDEPAIPVFFVFGDDGKIFFTNQGRSIQYLEDGAVVPYLVLDKTEYPVNVRAEDGLIGMDIVETDSGEYVYWYYGHGDIKKPEIRYRHRVMRIPLDSTSSSDIELIVDDLPVGPIDTSMHVAGAVEQGPDGTIFVSIGDTTIADDAQSISNLRGAILRMLPDGSGYSDNPFPEQPLMWAYGFRNPFDLSFDKDGRVYAIDVGGDMDEINIVESGENYGWPVVTGPDIEGRFTDPIWSFPSIGTPTGILVYSDESRSEYLDDIFVCEFNFMKLRWLRSEPHIGGQLTDMGWIGDDCITTVVQGDDGNVYYASVDGIRQLVLDE